MQALVVFESIFGNTERLAEVVAHGLGLRMAVTMTRADLAVLQDASATDLLVIGAPTHALTLPAPGTRRRAAARLDNEVGLNAGIREFLAALPPGGDRPVATFDTRHRWMRYLPGSAARAAARLSGRAGWRMLMPAQSFYVAGIAGPLLPGEADRAADWGEQLGRLAVLVGPPSAHMPRGHR